MLRDIHAKVEAAAAVVSTPALSVPSPGSSPGGPGLRREGAPVTLVRQLRRLASSVLRALELLQAEREGARSALLSSADQRDELLDKVGCMVGRRGKEGKGRGRSEVGKSVLEKGGPGHIVIG